MREQQPQAEFTDNHRLIAELAWPCTLWCRRARAWRFKARVPRPLLSFLTGHSCGLFGNDMQFLSVVVNQIMRHEALRATSASIRADTSSRRRFVAAVNDDKFVAHLREACHAPHSRQSAALLRRVMPFLATVAHTVPLSPGARMHHPTLPFLLRLRCARLWLLLLQRLLL